MRNFKNIRAFVDGKQVFCGIDVHEKHWVVCCVCDGEVVEKTKIRSNYAILKHLLSNYSSARKINSVYEAGFSGYWLCRKLRADGYSCTVTPPSLTPQTGSKVKTDKRDAQQLALFLSACILKSVTVPPEDIEADRRIVRRRAQIVRDKKRAKHQFLSFLKLNGVERPESIKTNWSQKHLEWLKNLEFEQPADNFTCKDLLKHYYRLVEDLTEVTRYLHELAEGPNYVNNYKILTSLRGVGLITAMTFLLEIFDFGRFPTSGQFSSYLGMTPSQYSSGEHVRLGHITRYGSAELRRVLIESAWTVIRYDPHLRNKYERLRARGTNGKKAIVAVARSLAVRLRRCLLDQTEYVIGVC